MLSGRIVGGFNSSIISIGTKVEILDAYDAFDVPLPPTYSVNDLLVVFVAGGAITAPGNETWSSSSWRSQCQWWVKFADGDATDTFHAPAFGIGARAYVQQIAVRTVNKNINVAHENGETFVGSGITDNDFAYPGISVQSITGENIVFTAGYKVMSSEVNFAGALPPLDYVDGGKDSGRAIAWGILRTLDPVDLPRGSFRPTSNEAFGHYGAAIRMNLYTP